MFKCVIRPSLTHHMSRFTRVHLNLDPSRHPPELPAALPVHLESARFGIWFRCVCFLPFHPGWNPNHHPQQDLTCRQCSRLRLRLLFLSSWSKARILTLRWSRIRVRLMLLPGTTPFCLSALFFEYAFPITITPSAAPAFHFIFQFYSRKLEDSLLVLVSVSKWSFTTARETRSG